MSDYIINDHGEKRPPTKEEELRQIITDLEAKLQEAEKMVGNLKCCGNCRGWLYNDVACLEAHDAYGLCDKWQSDNKTQEERKC